MMTGGTPILGNHYIHNLGNWGSDVYQSSTWLIQVWYSMTYGDVSHYSDDEWTSELNGSMLARQNRHSRSDIFRNRVHGAAVVEYSPGFRHDFSPRHAFRGIGLTQQLASSYPHDFSITQGLMGFPWVQTCHHGISVRAGHDSLLCSRIQSTFLKNICPNKQVRNTHTKMHGHQLCAASILQPEQNEPSPCFLVQPPFWPVQSIRIFA